MIFKPSSSWDWLWWWTLCILPKHNVPVSLTDISKHIIECFVCGVCSMPTQEMRVQPPLTLTGLYYKLQNNSSQSPTTSNEMWSSVPVTKSISQIQNTPPLSPTDNPPYCLPDIFFFIFYPFSYHTPVIIIFFTFIQFKCTHACLCLFKQMRGQLALTSLVSTRSSKIALFSRQTEVV